MRFSLSSNGRRPRTNSSRIRTRTDLDNVAVAIRSLEKKKGPAFLLAPRRLRVNRGTLAGSLPRLCLSVASRMLAPHATTRLPIYKSNRIDGFWRMQEYFSLILRPQDRYQKAQSVWGRLRC